MNQSELQFILLDKICSLFSKKTDAVDNLAEFLNIGKDAIYRRLRGETLLTPNEIKMLALKYRISIDAIIFQEVDSAFFTFSAFTRTIKTFEDYFSAIISDLSIVSNISNKHLYYASAEIPIFQYMNFPELLAFKLYVWGRTIWDFEYLRNQKFNINLVSPDVMLIAEKALDIYRNIPSTELWSLNLMDNTLNQIEYHFYTGSFADPKEAILICDKLTLLCKHMQNMTIQSKKVAIKKNSNGIEGAIFNLYHNEMIYTNNTLFITTDVGNALYVTHGNPNFLKCTDKRICNWTQDWFNKVISKSNLISADGGEKDRNFFFNRLQKKIEIVKNRLQATLDE